MLKKTLGSIMLISATLLSSCSMPPTKPPLTPLQIQLMQTKTFNIDKRTAFDSTVTVMQNLGYIVKNANFDTGIITAKSTQSADFWGNSKYTEASAFIKYRQSKKDSSIRINFVLHKIDQNTNSDGGMGSPITSSAAVEDPQAYKNAFTKIQQQIFVDTGVSPTQ
ncbi:hypothetical protein [Francisella halioticida]